MAAIVAAARLTSLPSRTSNTSTECRAASDPPRHLARDIANQANLACLRPARTSEIRYRAWPKILGRAPRRRLRLCSRLSCSFSHIHLLQLIQADMQASRTALWLARRRLSQVAAQPIVDAAPLPLASTSSSAALRGYYLATLPRSTAAGPSVSRAARLNPLQAGEASDSIGESRIHAHPFDAARAGLPQT